MQLFQQIITIETKFTQRRLLRSKKIKKLKKINKGDQYIIMLTFSAMHAFKMFKVIRDRHGFNFRCSFNA